MSGYASLWLSAIVISSVTKGRNNQFRVSSAFSNRSPNVLCCKGQTLYVFSFFLLSFWCCLHSALATFISKSSSLTGIHAVSAFIAFSKSESNSTSVSAWISAALVACRISSPSGKAALVLLLLLPSAAFRWPPLEEGGVPVVEDDSGGHSPISINTSQTRSCAGKGIERLKSVRYHRVP